MNSKSDNSEAIKADQLMAELAKGSQKAFKLLIQKHGGKVFGYAMKLLKNKETAEEVSQDVWLRVVKAAPSYTASGSFNSWILTITRNLCLNHIKKSSRMILKEADELERDINKGMQNFEQEDKLFSELEAIKLKEKLNELPDKQRIALTMLLGEGLTYEDVAHELEMSLGAVKSLIFRARKKLSLQLREAL